MPCSPGMRNCASSCAHRRFVRDYQAERMRQEMVRDADTLGYPTELEGYPEIVTFKSWLVDHAAPSLADATVEPPTPDWEPPPGF